MSGIFRNARARPAQPIIPAAIICGAALLWLFWVAATSTPSALTSPELSAATPDTDAALARLVADGLPVRGVTIRDWGSIDGDGAHINGVRIVAGARPQPLVLAGGTLTLTGFAGSLGCITLEVSAPGRPPYRLCLDPGTATPAIPVR